MNSRMKKVTESPHVWRHGVQHLNEPFADSIVVLGRNGLRFTAGTDILFEEHEQHPKGTHRIALKPGLSEPPFDTRQSRMRDAKVLV